MDLNRYLENRKVRLAQQPERRRHCINCLQPDFSCYCSWLEPFNAGIEFVILMHPMEFRRRIATGRMTHMSLTNSHMFTAEDFTKHHDVNGLLRDPKRKCFMLYPAKTAVNLSSLSATDRFDLIDEEKTTTIFVIDGTWSTARKMVRLSDNLQSIPRICFIPPEPSNFHLRKQPKVNCYCTLEAVHHTIELLGEACGFKTKERQHDALLETFDKMVRHQFDLTHNIKYATKRAL
jgi:DTW domain-containing protein YfiP